MFEKLADRSFQILTLHHAEAILRHDMQQAATELETALHDISIPIKELIRGGGGEGEITQRLRHRLSDEFGWNKHEFEIKKIVDGIERESITHEIDHVKKFGEFTIALEIEWNNKDPFFDRDLENFKRLHADGVISIGAILTRGTSFQNEIRSFIEKAAHTYDINDLESLLKFYSPTSRQQELINDAATKAGSFAKGWSKAFCSDKFGEATTHWRKLEDRVKRGVGNPCPLLLVGIPSTVLRID